jgi:hypothetical protein
MALFKPIGDFLDANDATHRLAGQASLLLRLRETAAQAVPHALRQSMSIANYKQGKVVIFAENNAIAAKLRLYEPGLIDLWARQGVQVNAVRVEVQPAFGAAVGRIKQARLPPCAERALTDLAARLPAGSALQAQMRAIATRARRRDDKTGSERRQGISGIPGDSSVCPDE